MVALEGADDRPEHGQRPYAVEQDGRRQPLGQVAPLVQPGLAVDQPAETPVQVQGSAHDAPEGYGHDEKNGVLALGQMGDGCVEPDGQAGQPQPVVEHGLVLFLDASVEQCAQDAAHDDSACVDNRS